MRKIYIISFILILLLGFSVTTSAQKNYEAYINDAFSFFEKKNFAAAEQAYKAAMRLEPDNPGNILLMMNLGTIQRHLGKYEEALISYNVVLQHKPDLNYALVNRALLYCDMDRYDDALEDYTTILLNDPNNKEAIYNQALIYISQRKLDKAEDDFNQLLTIDANDTRAKAGLAMIMKRRGQWKEAEQAYTDLIAEDKRNGELYGNRAECYINMKRLNSLSEDLNKAQEYGYDNFSLHILRGQLRLAQYDKQAAKTEFEKAMEMGADPKVVEEFLLLCK